MTIEDTFSRLLTAFSRLHSTELSKDKDGFPWENRDTSLTLTGLNLKLDWKTFGLRPVGSIQDWAGLSNAYNSLHYLEEALEWLQSIQSLYSSHQTLLLECNFTWRTWYILLEQWLIHVQQQVFSSSQTLSLFHVWTVFLNKQKKQALGAIVTKAIRKFCEVSA